MSYFISLVIFSLSLLPCISVLSITGPLDKEAILVQSMSELKSTTSRAYKETYHNEIREDVTKSRIAIRDFKPTLAPPQAFTAQEAALAVEYKGLFRGHLQAMQMGEIPDGYRLNHPMPPIMRHYFQAIYDKINRSGVAGKSLDSLPPRCSMLDATNLILYAGLRRHAVHPGEDQFLEHCSLGEWYSSAKELALDQGDKPTDPKNVVSHLNPHFVQVGLVHQGSPFLDLIHPEMMLVPISGKYLGVSTLLSMILSGKGAFAVPCDPVPAHGVPMAAGLGPHDITHAIVLDGGRNATFAAPCNLTAYVRGETDSLFLLDLGDLLKEEYALRVGVFARIYESFTRDILPVEGETAYRLPITALFQILHELSWHLLPSEYVVRHPLSLLDSIIDQVFQELTQACLPAPREHTLETSFVDGSCPWTDDKILDDFRPYIQVKLRENDWNEEQDAACGEDNRLLGYIDEEGKPFSDRLCAHDIQWKVNRVLAGVSVVLTLPGRSVIKLATPSNFAHRMTQTHDHAKLANYATKGTDIPPLVEPKLTGVVEEDFCLMEEYGKQILDRWQFLFSELRRRAMPYLSGHFATNYWEECEANRWLLSNIQHKL